MPHFSTNVNTSAHVADHESSSLNADARAERLLIKNRRKRYLDLHPEYFTDANRELADPLLYDRLVRQFMTAEEREHQGRERGFAGSLEADIVRSEAKMEAVEQYERSDLAYVRQDDGTVAAVEREEGERARTKEEGWSRWIDVLTQRFLMGEDKDFDYEAVDRNELYDDVDEEERGRLEDYLDQQEDEFVGSGVPQGQTGVQDF